jgi:hypothetical protein
VIYQAIARRIEDNFARRERCRKTKKESTIKTNITAIDKKYLVENLVRDLNICLVDRSNYCLEECSIR